MSDELHTAFIRMISEQGHVHAVRGGLGGHLLILEVFAQGAAVHAQIIAGSQSFLPDVQQACCWCCPVLLLLLLPAILPPPPPPLLLLLLLLSGWH